MRRIAVLVWIGCLILIGAGCSTQPSPPQIVKVPQKVKIETPAYPNILNPKEWCKRNESECISGILAYNFIEAVEFGAKYDVNVKAYR